MCREPLLLMNSVPLPYSVGLFLNSFLVLFCAIIKLVPHCKKLQPFPHSNQLGIVCFVSHNLICMIFVHDFSKPSLINPCELVSGHSIHHGDKFRDEGFLTCTPCQKFHFAILLTITELHHHQFEPSARKHTCLYVLLEVPFALLSKITKLKQQFEKHLTKSITATTTTTTRLMHRYSRRTS
jgi:hypothetical protein